MTLFPLIMTNLLTTLLFTQTSHPLTMTLTIVLQTLLICLLTGITSQSFWFSYILFLVFLGGMLVLFIYITSLASNEMFFIPLKTLLSLSLLMLLTSLFIWLIDYTFITSTIQNLDMLLNSETLTNYKSETLFPLTKLYNNPTNLNTLMLVLYLFLTLIAIVKITNIFSGPLRTIY
uniref:NADH-ubiquinone oxidoreductase chain 6 n=1 Tax=Camptonotus carolinensis TaxID=114793 RepID=A0A0N7AXP8_9ORTH|nr:NADH dehydrogenase subunit 6 [Camptonotus carolinensis]AJW76340.1 NADH dehydrogenase subunit 6 [Camptonotus carolinensis]